MDPPGPGNAFYLGFGGSLAGTVIRLDLDASVEGLGVDPRDPPVQWEVSAQGMWISTMILNDDTGGLARARSDHAAHPRWQRPAHLARHPGVLAQGTAAVAAA